MPPRRKARGRRQFLFCELFLSCRTPSPYRQADRIYPPRGSLDESDAFNRNTSSAVRIFFHFTVQQSTTVSYTENGSRERRFRWLDESMLDRTRRAFCKFFTSNSFMPRQGRAATFLRRAVARWRSCPTQAAGFLALRAHFGVAEESERLTHA
jgi:hypothetical protein